MATRLLQVTFWLVLLGTFAFSPMSASDFGKGLDDPYSADIIVAQDTIPLNDRFGDFINDNQTNPFDLQDPSIIEKEVEYDPISGRYIITERIGEDYYRMPTDMSFEDYLEYRREEQERAYFQQLAGVSSRDGRGGGRVDPMKRIKIDRNMADRLFGGAEVEIKPQGFIDLTFGVDFQRVENPILTQRQQNQGGFDFDMGIQMGVEGSIGDKLRLSTNYNTLATFDFENTMNLTYDSEQWTEDDIIKKIEAGNVSLPLRSTLIQGSQSLFGLKVEAQFAKLRLTGLVSQQRSRRENLTLEGGSQVQQFETRIDQYDENRHFFLTHFNRETFTEALANLPQINSLFRVTKIEVAVTNDRNATQNVRDVIAITDIGEPDRVTNDNPRYQAPATPRHRDIFGQRGLPGKNTQSLIFANDILADLEQIDQARKIDRAVAILQSQFRFDQIEEFEKVNARLLNQSEYTFHPELGFLSLNVQLQPDQVLAVSFEYDYNGQTYKVGEFWNDATDTSDVVFMKMLKATTPRIGLPIWDLMMKNVYNIGAFNVNQNDFRLDIFYEDPGAGEKRFLPLTQLNSRPLLQIFNLDQLNVQGDPRPDGVFDFVPGVTINPRNGRIMFPVLEPFGTNLKQEMVENGVNENVADQFTYQMLYDSTITRAREYPEFNRFTIRGEYKSSVSSEISLGAFNLPRGSVTVRAGGQVLREGIDYEIDYNIGRVRILNDAYLASAQPINISFEDNTLFGFQTRTMLGLRADYAVNENLQVGGTFMQLFERPFTQKVNIGDDPINNKIYGLDINYSKEAPFITKMVDALPFIDTKEESNLTFAAEAAVLRPGHSRAINQGLDEDGDIDSEGQVYLDDFEGSTSSFDLRQPATNWVLSSVPQNDRNNNNPLFPESEFIDTTLSGVNRARLAWYRIDQTVRLDGSPTGVDPYTVGIPQTEVFPNFQLQPGFSPFIQTLDLNFDPRQRGPYNFDLPNDGTDYSAGINSQGELNDPSSRWGGMMRAIQTNDFEAANIEFIEFWMLNPFIFGPNDGDLYINLGSVSEDILRDSRRFFENGIPVDDNTTTIRTNWGRIPRGQNVVNAFDNDPDNRRAQDVGLDGLDNAGERAQFADVLTQYETFVQPDVYNSIEEDPSSDDFRFFRDFPANTPVLERYSRFNNPEGNSQPSDGQLLTSSTALPDAEDIDRDNTMNETEAYFQYKIPLKAVPSPTGAVSELDFNNRFITDSIHAGNNRIWYRFKVPITQFTSQVGGIQDFRSIRFIRMYMHGFQNPVTLRFARLELVRNQWRRYLRPLVVGSGNIGTNPDDGRNVEFDVNDVNIEENSSRFPFGYILPPGIQREQSNQTAFPDILQNEQSLAVNVCNLNPGGARGIYKIINFDMRVYDRLRMFVHAEDVDDPSLDDGEMSIFMRLGSDFTNNYYEYEIPLTLSKEEGLSPYGSDEYKNEVWRPENEFDFLLRTLRDIKLERNNSGFPLNVPYETVDPEKPGNTIRVRGNPNLGLVKNVMVGIVNNDGIEHCAEIWINELRVSGFDERGGLAAIARLDMNLADLGNATLSTSYSSIGFGQLEERVNQRAREATLQYDAAANIELGRFLPEKSGIKIPFYMQFSRVVQTPEFDPYDLDVPLEQKIEAADPSQRDSIARQAKTVNEIRGYNFTNVRKERTNTSKKPKPWDIENFSLTYAFTETNSRDPIIESDNIKTYSGIVNYNYNMKPLYIEPFKKLIKKDKYLKLIKDISLNVIPNNISVSTNINRTAQETRYRFAGTDPFYNTFYNRQFTWDRNYNVQWDITRALKLNFNALANSVIDEPDVFNRDENSTQYAFGERIPDDVIRDSIWTNINNLGRMKNYTQNVNVSYTLPFKKIPFLDWVNVRAQYNGSYNWAAAALNVDSLGNVISNSQTRQLNADLNFESLYKKSKYLKKIDAKKRRSNSRNRNRNRDRSQKDDKQKSLKKDEDDKGKKKKKKSSGPSTIERVLVRPLLSLRKARASFSENFTTVIPGYTPNTTFFGMQDFGAPGWEFVSGLQPDIAFTDNENDYLTRAAANGWITDNAFQNQQVIQNYQQTIDARITIEPFRDFKIDVEASRSFTENTSLYFRDTTYDAIPNNFEEIVHTTPREIGSFNMSYFALNTLFRSDDQLIQMFQTFQDYRIIISQRLGTGVHDNPEQSAYSEGYGATQQEVLLPAFIAAYTGQDPATMELSENYANDVLFKELPRLNWRFQYNGLSKLPWFEQYFNNFNITHGYKSNLTVNSFATEQDFVAARPRLKNPTNLNFYSRFEIPAVVVQEDFSPLFGFDMKMKSGMNVRMDYKKSRQLQMSFLDFRLAETRTTEYVFGFGHTIKGVNMPFIPESMKKKRKDKDKSKQQNQQNQKNNQNNRNNRNPQGAGQGQGADLNINFDVSFRDDVTYNHQLDQNTFEPTRGLRSIRISPSIDYNITEQLNARAFFDYSRTNPKTSASFPITNWQGGITLRFTLN